jgi:hypothetical protein
VQGVAPGQAVVGFGLTQLQAQLGGVGRHLEKPPPGRRRREFQAGAEAVVGETVLRLGSHDGDGNGKYGPEVGLPGHEGIDPAHGDPGGVGQGEVERNVLGGIGQTQVGGAFDPGIGWAQDQIGAEIKAGQRRGGFAPGGG